MTSEEFEKKVEWIEYLLKGEGAQVKWNDRIPDPDNPEQQRQIDITIKRENLLIIVECRLHSEPQDVTWIEELYGRRISLNADSVIAVSASGFTKGAVLKAERLGIVLRGFRTITEDEVRNWGIAADVYLEYIRFFDTIFYLISEPSDLYSSIPEQAIFTEIDGKAWPVELIFREVAAKLNKSARGNGGVRIQLFTDKLFFKSRRFTELIFQSNYEKINFPLRLPVVSVYAVPNVFEEDGIYIQSQTDSDFEIYRHEKRAFLIVDMSVVLPMHNHVFRSIKFDFKKPVALKGFKLLAKKADSISLLYSQIKCIQKNSELYKTLMTEMPTE